MKVFYELGSWLITKSMATPFYHLDRYMARYWLVPFSTPNGSNGCGPVIFLRRPIAWIAQKLDIAARVHCILRSDSEDAFHDHPWPYLSVILQGGYFEIKPIFDKSNIYVGESRTWHGPGSVLYRPAGSWHKLEVPEGQVAWTLFITGKWRQRWGFLVHPRAKVYYREHLNIPGESHNE